MTDEVKKLVEKKQEIAHNDELGNNYYPSGWKPQRSWDNNTNTGEVTHIQPKTDNFKFRTTSLKCFSRSYIIIL